MRNLLVDTFVRYDIVDVVCGVYGILPELMAKFSVVHNGFRYSDKGSIKSFSTAIRLRVVWNSFLVDDDVRRKKNEKLLLTNSVPLYERIDLILMLN